MRFLVLDFGVYALSGTDLGNAATHLQCAVRVCCYQADADLATEILTMARTYGMPLYAPTRCLVLA
eukprot:1248462-Rhodomonas_salina.1